MVGCKPGFRVCSSSSCPHPHPTFLTDATLNVPNKRQVFEKNVELKILNAELKTQLDAYSFTLEEGFQLKDTNDIFRKLQKEGKISTNFRMISSKLHKEMDAIALLKSI